MLDQSIVIFCICDEVCKTFDLKDDTQCKMSTAEVMAFAVSSATLFGCNYKKTRLLALYLRLYSKVLSHSQLVRRIHQVPEEAWLMVFYSLRVFLQNKTSNMFIVDSFPVKAYENHKSLPARIFKGKEYHGYTASKKQYFFGIKVHMVVDTDGIPIEFSFTPGSTSDIKALKSFDLDLPKQSIILADKAYNDYQFEDILFELQQLNFLAKRKNNSKRPHTSASNGYLEKRNRVETVFSSIVSRMPRSIKARTEVGFRLKILFFILAYMVERYYPMR